MWILAPFLSRTRLPIVSRALSIEDAEVWGKLWKWMKSTVQPRRIMRSAATGEWSLEPLGWGPLYEPHRHPAGAEVGRRLLLPAGRYRLSLVAEALGGGDPALVVTPDRPGAPPRWGPARPVAGGWEADFEVRPGERAVGLRWLGGGPMLLKGLSLAVQPTGPGPV